MNHKTKEWIFWDVVSYIGAILLGNLLAGKGVRPPKFCNISVRGVIRGGECKIRSGKGINRAGQGFNAVWSFN